MGVDVKLLIVNEKDGEKLNEHLIMANIKNALNEFIMGSYDENNIQNFEKSRLPVIKNRARVSDLDYNVDYNEEREYLSHYYNVNFPVFVNKNEHQESASKIDFKGVSKNNEVVFNEGRTLFIHPNTFDYQNEVENKHKESNKMILSLSAWGKSEDLMKHIGEYVSKKIGVDYYFTPNDCSVDLKLFESNKESKVNDFIFSKKENNNKSSTRNKP
jgi:hypothetical protein